MNEISDLIIHVGDATGLDSLVIRYCQEHNLKYKIFKARWDLYGKSAGPKRNEELIKDSNVLIAFPSVESKGTIHAINFAKKLNIQVIIFNI